MPDIIDPLSQPKWYGKGKYIAFGNENKLMPTMTLNCLILSLCTFLHYRLICGTSLPQRLSMLSSAHCAR